MTEPNTNPVNETFAAANEATEQVAHQAREFGERAAGTGKAMGQLALDTYEKAVEGFVEFEQQAAEATQVDWLKSVLGAHAAFVKDLNDAYVKAARGVLD
jgi:predicted transcriptional regulator